MRLLSTTVRTIVVLAAALALAACAEFKEPLDYTWIIHSPERSDADRALDQRRKPDRLLEFYEVRPGMRVFDMSSGRGYNAELLARVIGPTGRVYAHNSPSMLMPASKVAMEARLKTPPMQNVVYVEREFEDPFPPEARNLDLVVFNFNYHDTVHHGTDRARMNRAVFEALKPGGVYIVADHSAAPGAGTSVTRTLHRIEESSVRQEIEAAGFRLIDVGDFLRNPTDPRTVSVFKNTVSNDEFVLKFVKPKR
jgi:predicted methyltransferase